MIDLPAVLDILFGVLIVSSLLYTIVYILWLYSERVGAKERQAERKIQANGKTYCWHQSHEEYPNEYHETSSD